MCVIQQQYNYTVVLNVTILSLNWRNIRVDFFCKTELNWLLLGCSVCNSTEAYFRSVNLQQYNYTVVLCLHMFTILVLHWMKVFPLKNRYFSGGTGMLWKYTLQLYCSSSQIFTISLYWRIVSTTFLFPKQNWSLKCQDLLNHQNFSCQWRRKSKKKNLMT